MNESVFPDAKSFKPERWMADKATVSHMDGYFFGFGQGTRGCLGKNISLLEMSKAVPQLVRKYDFELVKPDQEWTISNTLFSKPVDFGFRVHRREFDN